MLWSPMVSGRAFKEKCLWRVHAGQLENIFAFLDVHQTR